MQSFLDRLANRPVLADGGWGTLLAQRGLPAGAAPERWTLEHPDVIAEIAIAYADAGAELITTNTFGGSPMRLALHRLGGDFARINRDSVAIVKEAVGARAFVNASIGPTGRLLAPLGDADPEEVLRGFMEQARILIESGADVITIETMTDLEEALIAVRAVRSVRADIPLIASMTFDMTPRGAFTVMGTSVPQASKALANAGASLVGSNCGAGLDDMTAVASEFLACATIPISIQPNAGLPVHHGGELTWPELPERFAERLAAIAASGVRIVGGCCGTTPAHIAALRARLSSLSF